MHVLMLLCNLYMKPHMHVPTCFLHLLPTFPPMASQWKGVYLYHFTLHNIYADTKFLVHTWQFTYQIVHDQHRDIQGTELKNKIVNMSYRCMLTWTFLGHFLVVLLLDKLDLQGKMADTIAFIKSWRVTFNLDPPQIGSPRN